MHQLFVVHKTTKVFSPFVDDGTVNEGCNYSMRIKNETLALNGGGNSRSGVGDGGDDIRSSFSSSRKLYQKKDKS